MQDRGDQNAWQRAFDIAHQEPPGGISPEQAVAEDMLDSVGDTCPEGPPA